MNDDIKGKKQCIKFIAKPKAIIPTYTPKKGLNTQANGRLKWKLKRKNTILK